MSNAKTQDALLVMIDHLNDEYANYAELRAMLIEKPRLVSLGMLTKLAETALKLTEAKATPGARRLEQGLETGLMLGYYAARDPQGFQEIMAEFTEFKRRHLGENVVGIGARK